MIYKVYTTKNGIIEIKDTYFKDKEKNTFENILKNCGNIYYEALKKENEVKVKR